MTVQAIVLAATLVGSATWYPYEVYGGNPLYCDRNGSLRYTLDESSPWIAVHFELFVDGWQCYDWVRVQFADGTTKWARVLDAGLIGWYKADGRVIVADWPEQFWPYALPRQSAPVSVWNGSLANRLGIDVAF